MPPLPDPDTPDPDTQDPAPRTSVARPRPGDGLVVVDKPAGWTSHDVVGRCRRLLGTRRVGHAGTLDPAATGVLVLGVERGTKFLAHLLAHEKSYTATVRLGLATVTDDAQGEPLGEPVAATGLAEADVAAAVAALTGAIAQVPSSVSAIKVDGRRSYARVRGGEEVELAARPVTVHRFDVLARREADPFCDLDIAVTVSAGTYVRALARDLGAALGVGGHLTALRRTASGPFDLGEARTLTDLEQTPAVTPLVDVARRLFPVRTVDAEQVRALTHGGFLAPQGVDGVVAALDEDGRLIALVEEVDRRGRRGAKPVLVVATAS